MLFFLQKYLHISKICSTFAPAFEKSIKNDESVAQQVEHIPFKDGVLGSSPSWFTEQHFAALFFTNIMFLSRFARTIIAITSRYLRFVRVPQ